jgi:hypothetical protein
MQDVGRCESLRKTSIRARILQVERQAALVAVERDEEQAVRVRAILQTRRATSPFSGSSTLMTSAPSQANICPQEGPPDCSSIDDSDSFQR